MITFALVLGLIFVPPALISKTHAYAVEEPGQPTRAVRIPGEYIVTLKPDAVGEPEAGDLKSSNISLAQQRQNIFIAAAGAEELVQDQGANVTQIYDRVLNGFVIKGVEDVTPLVQDPAIDTVEPNFKVWPQTQYFPTAEDRLDLDRAVTLSSRPDNREQRPNLDVAVVDQPVTTTHPDLVVVARTNTIDGCGSLKISGGATLACYNENGHHGTHVAGSMAAKDNLGGIVGGLPGARIHSYSVCSVNNGCTGADILQAWNLIITNGQIEIANMSVGACGGEPVNSAHQTAGTNLANAGVTMFVSAGNCNRNANGFYYCGVTAFICVSAMADFDGKCGGKSSLTQAGSAGTSSDDRRAAFSNHGTDVDIMAPGVAVLSTLPGSDPVGDPGPPTSGWGDGRSTAVYIGTSEKGKYGTLSGTSMSSPIAAGIGALVKFKNPAWAPATIKSDLQAKAYSQTQACDNFGKGGLVSGGNSESSEKILYAQPY